LSGAAGARRLPLLPGSEGAGFQFGRVAGGGGHARAAHAGKSSASMATTCPRVRETITHGALRVVLSDRITKLGHEHMFAYCWTIGRFRWRVRLVPTDGGIAGTTCRRW
jgi:hypothetical protein